MPLTQTQTQVLEKIQANLKRNDIGSIAEKTGLSRVWVSKTLSLAYDDYNEDIVREAVNIINKREQVNKELLKKLPA